MAPSIEEASKIRATGSVIETADNAGISESIIELSDELLAKLPAGNECDSDSQIIEALFVDTKASETFVHGIIKMERLFPDAGEWEPRHRAAGLHRWYKIEYEEPVPQTKAEEGLGHIPGVLSIESPLPVKMTGSKIPFNDPYGPQQWQYYNDGTIYPGFVDKCDINVVPAWQEFNGGRPEVIIAVVDDGIYYNHPDLKGVVIPGGENGSKNFIRNNYELVGGDHGSHVAGIIGAINNNGTGCCGVAGGLNGKGGVKLLSCQIFEDNPNDPDHPYSGNTADAIVWGADHGAVICQNSWGYEYNSEYQAKYGSLPSSMKNAIDYFIRNAGTDSEGNQNGPMKGGIVIFAAGNDGWRYAQPASYEKVIAVGATGPDGRRASYSNYGDWVDICAPGGESDRFPSSNGKSYILSTASAKYNYVYMCGTSMSCPMVSGVAGLIVSEFGGEGFTNEMLWDLLIQNSNKTVIPETDRIGGMVDAYASLVSGARGKSKITTAYTGNFRIATGEDLSVTFSVESETEEYYTMSLTSDGSVSMIDSKDGECTLTFDSDSKYVGRHKATIQAESRSDQCSLTISYEIYINQPPVIKISYSGPTTLKWNEQAVLNVTCTDPEGQDGMVNTIKCTPEGLASAKETENGLEVTVGNRKGDHVGQVTVEVHSKDKFGAESSTEATFSILENRVPATIKAFEDYIIRPEDDKVTIDGKTYFSDPDDEILNISYKVDNTDIIRMSSIGEGYVIRGGKDGWTSVTITATDGLGKSCSGSFKVGVYDDSKGPTLFPNPVRDKLTIRIGKEDNVTLVMRTEMGTEVLSMSGKASIFEPMVVDLSGLAPGRYPSTITCGGKTYKKEIVKL